MIATTSDLLGFLHSHRLLSADQLSALAGEAQAADARVLARLLVQRGWLTRSTSKLRWTGPSGRNDFFGGSPGILQEALGIIGRKESWPGLSPADRSGVGIRLSSGDEHSVFLWPRCKKKLPQHAWFIDNAPDKTCPVGKLSPNAWGLHDMHGNVWEWCADVGRSYTLSPVTDPLGPLTGPGRALRGGGVSTAGPRWDAIHLRSAFRLPNYGVKANNVGFRIVCEVQP